MVERGQEQTLKDLLLHGTRVLQTAAVPEANLESELLLGFCLNKSRTELYLCSGDQVSRENASRFIRLLARREKREPLSYITGEKEFWSLDFFVSPAVLIPRPETEFLIETVLAKRNQNASGTECLDLCCGSGIISVVLSLELNRRVIGVDVSSQVLKISRKNVLRHGLGSKISLVQADLLSCFLGQQSFSLIVSNPPYVPREEIENDLEPEVGDYEPRLALDGGESGLDVITAIRDSLPMMLASGGDCFLEIGDCQGDAIRKLFLEHECGSLYCTVNVLRDYSGRERVVHIRRSDY